MSHSIQNPSLPLMGSIVSGLTRIIAPMSLEKGRNLGIKPTAPSLLSKLTAVNN